MHFVFDREKIKNDVLPISYFERLRKYRAYILESGNRDHWSFVGLGRRTHMSLRGLRGRSNLKVNENLPPFIGGYVGFLSYDFGAKLLGIKQKVKNDIGCPEVFFLWSDQIVAFDHIKRELWFLAIGNKQKEAAAKLKDLRKKLENTSPRNGDLKIHVSPFRSNLTQSAYQKKLAKIREYLFAGETYQANFSQRFEASFSGDPFEIYKRVTRLNPSPFQAYFETPQFAVISNSPERLVKGKRVENQIFIQTQPIKGTFPRGKNRTEDGKNIERLLRSRKDEAELTMIVDLERNDLGKICLPHSVFVREHRAIEKYSHVIHTVSRIQGVLDPQYDFWDVIKALFPGGSVTGCPKKRTMEIIDELEDFKRGVYTGSAGYLSVNGDFDFNIMIRTMWCDRKKGKLYLHSGGGIVVDSDPKKEWDETLHKAKAFQVALIRGSALNYTTS